MNSGTVIVHRITPLRQTDNAALTDSERQRAASFRFQADRELWIGWRVALRRILGDTLSIPAAEVPIHTSRQGKPLLAPPFGFLHFSLSHCAELALLAVCLDGPVGIDIEPSARACDLIGCEPGFCHPGEIAHLPGDPAERGMKLLEIWTAKEALLKAAGTGFLHPPESLRIRNGVPFGEIEPEHLPADFTRQIVRRLLHPALEGFVVALSAPARACSIVVGEGSTLRPDSGIITPRMIHTDG